MIHRDQSNLEAVRYFWFSGFLVSGNRLDCKRAVKDL